MRLLLRVKRATLSNLPLIFVLVIGFVLRVVAVKPGIYSNGDEAMYGEAVTMIIYKSLSMAPQWMGYPPLVAWIMLLGFLFFFIPLRWIWLIIFEFDKFKYFEGRSIFEFLDALAIGEESYFNRYIFGHNWEFAKFWGRYLTVFFGTAAIYVSYQLCLKFFKDKPVALLVTLLIAVNYRLVLSSHIGFIDMYGIFFLLLAFLKLLDLLKKPTKRNYIIAWVTVTLSFLVKYQIYAIFPMFIAHYFIAYDSSKQWKKRLKNYFFDQKMIQGGLIALLLVLAAHFYHFKHFDRVVEINNYEALKYGFGRKVINFFVISYYYHVGIGKTLSILGIGGIALGLVKRKYRRISILLLSIFPYLIYMYGYYSVGGFFTRNLMVVIPIWIIFVGLLMREARRKVGILVTLVLFFPFVWHLNNSIIMARGYSSAANFEKAEEWLNGNIPKNSTVATFQVSPGNSIKNADLKSLPGIWEIFSFQEMLNEKYEYAVLDMVEIQSHYTWWMNQPEQVGLAFWNRPDDLLSQDYVSLAFRELLWRGGLATFYSPWQAPNQGYVAVKINKAKEVEYDSIELNPGNWKELVFFNIDEFGYLRRNKEGGLKIKNSRQMPGTLRWSSEALKAKPGYQYKVIGWIGNSEKITKRERDGFLRIDFYKDEPRIVIDERPILSLVSERAFGESGLHQVEAVGIAPKDAMFVTIGFQADKGEELCLERMEFFESKVKVEGETEGGFTISDDDLFLPNNSGVL